ncbi:hypothetical protein AKN94_05540 [Thiopseudomonas alkaliphila]|uniref:hypothetical protein n=1 Tax=Thiopseudomonas alkaliphila TaxID=1697053 RepID=UPI00069EB073|nr:hypothetical protein [Thiopseudomonas alkaliphila]AKX46878.1 hypothetical protein AKN94_05540 [Thiopseudomonas alkaliphila]
MLNDKYRGPVIAYKGQYALLFLSFMLPVFLLSYYFNLTAKSLNNVFYIGLALPSLIFALLNFKGAAFVFRKFWWLFLFILVVSFLDILRVKELKHGIYLLLFFFSCLLIDRGEEKLKYSLLPYSLVCVAIMLYVTTDWIWIWTHSGNWIRYSYWFDVYVHPGFFSMLICFGLIVFWAFFLGPFLENKFGFLAYIVGLGMFSLVVLLCTTIFQSRSALIGYLLFFIGLIIYKRAYWLGLIIITLLAIFTFGFGFDEVLANRGSSQRFIIWQEVVWQLFYECSAVLGCDLAPGYKILDKYYHPHNVYLAMFYRNGLLGGGLFCIFMAYFFYRGIKVKSVWLVVSLFGWGALITENDSLFTTPEPFWVYFWLPVFMTILDSHKSQVQGYWRQLTARADAAAS